MIARIGLGSEGFDSCLFSDDYVIGKPEPKIIIFVEIKGLNLAVKNGRFSFELVKMHIIFYSPIIIPLNFQNIKFERCFLS